MSDMDEREEQVVVQWLVNRAMQSLRFRVIRGARIARNRTVWFICGLWFWHDIDPLTCRCRNCGIGDFDVQRYGTSPCLELWLSGLQWQILFWQQKGHCSRKAN
jgi:hypothetical protein